MSQEHLTHGLTVKFPPSLHAELSAVSEREGVSCGHIIRRALRAELDGVETHRLDPFGSLPTEEIHGHINEAFAAVSSPEAVEGLIGQIADELSDLVLVSLQSLDAIYQTTTEQNLERVSGYLQQASRHLLVAAFRAKALRVNLAVAGGEPERIEARLRSEGQPEERN